MVNQLINFVLKITMYNKIKKDGKMNYNRCKTCCFFNIKSDVYGRCENPKLKENTYFDTGFLIKLATKYHKKAVKIKEFLNEIAAGIELYTDGDKFGCIYYKQDIKILEIHLNNTLTEKQKNIYNYIVNYIEMKSYAPSIREIQAELGLKSINGVVCHLTALEKKGYIKREKNKNRAITIL